MRKILLSILVVLLILLAIVVGSRNTEIVTVNYLIAQIDMRLSTFMVVSLLIGFCIGFSTILTRYLSLKVKMGLLKRKLAKIKQDT
ncbi:lipopolysaccharide assembly protein LapA domain-containing protein [Glaciecola sp. 1036]|uniref:lipopolysaccharide assembly protein LapA domain-containing protein n=1 Tax=Alteromonadaceae TaxID=72275 RepID=UPI003D01A977